MEPSVFLLATVVPKSSFSFHTLQSFSSPLERRNFGKDRLWGAVSWGCVHVIVGHIIDASGGSFSILFPASLLSFLCFITACRFARQPEALDTSQKAASLEVLSESESEADTDALVAKSRSDSQADTLSEQKELQQQRQRMSVFRILCLASGTVFGSLASVVFFLNLFFINIGTNVVEGLVRAIQSLVYCFCLNALAGVYVL